jgi:hypothetical protein
VPPDHQTIWQNRWDRCLSTLAMDCKPCVPRAARRMWGL